MNDRLVQAADLAPSVCIAALLESTCRDQLKDRVVLNAQVVPHPLILPYPLVVS
jgi:hypothetical protein